MACEPHIPTEKARGGGGSCLVEQEGLHTATPRCT